MTVEILTPDQVIFQGEADHVQLPGIDGSFGVLKNHAPIISTLQKGTVKVSLNGKDQDFELNGGVVEVINNRVIVLGE